MSAPERFVRTQPSTWRTSRIQTGLISYSFVVLLRGGGTAMLHAMRQADAFFARCMRYQKDVAASYDRCSQPCKTLHCSKRIAKFACECFQWLGVTSNGHHRKNT